MFKNTDLLSQTSSSGIIGQPFIVLPQVESTNNYAMGLVHEGMATHGMSVFTFNQTAGKGQRGKAWLSEPGVNLILSVIIKPDARLTGFRLPALIANACCRFLEQYAKSEVFVKWPNDIYWRDRKAGGILIENSFRENDWHWSVIGIGINLNQINFDPSILNPVSLRQITGQLYEPRQMAENLCGFLNESLKDPHVESIMPEYNSRLFKKDEMVRLRKEAAIFQTTVREVNHRGELVCEDSIERSFTFGQVEWLL